MDWRLQSFYEELQADGFLTILGLLQLASSILRFILAAYHFLHFKL
jgi:hypothetical protein